MTRVMVISDLHCGHLVGLTPEDWDAKPGEGYGSKAHSFYRMRRDGYRWYQKKCEELKPDWVIVNGDCVDGKGKKSGGTELLTADRNEQCDMAVAVIKETGAKNVVMSFGTSYHTGVDEDWERQVAKGVDGHIESEGNLKVHGIVFNYRHFAGASSIPYGRGTPLAKEAVWNMLWAMRDEYPRADIILRSHVHYFTYIGDADYLAISTPGLQGYGSKFGTRIKSNTVDFGVIWFDVEEDGSWGWDWEVKRFRKKHAFAGEV